MPMHHLHISSFALFLIVLFVLGFMSILFAFIVSMRKAKVNTASHGWIDERMSGSSFRQSERGPIPSSGGYAAAPGVYASPMVAPVMMQGGSGSDLLTGVLLGEALSGGHRDTVIVESGGGYGGGYDAPAYDPGPSFDSGISYDSGPTIDTGGGGGIDLTW